MNPRSRRRFDEQLEWVLQRLPPLIHELIEKVPLHVEDYPSEEVMDRMRVRYIDDLCGLYTGIPIGDKSVTHSGTLPDVVTIYREGILTAAANRQGRIRTDRLRELIHTAERLASVDHGRAARAFTLLATAFENCGALASIWSGRTS